MTNTDGNRVTIRLKHEEYMELKEIAKRSGLDMATVARTCIVAGRIKTQVKRELDECLTFLHANLNELHSKISAFHKLDAKQRFSKRQRVTLTNVIEAALEKMWTGFNERQVKICEHLEILQKLFEKFVDRQDKFSQGLAVVCQELNRLRDHVVDSMRR